MEEYQVIIHAGGKGTRLLPLTLEKPKPLLAVDDKTLIEHSIQPFLTAGFKKFIVTASYKADMIKKFLADKGIEATFIREDQAAGRAGAIRFGIEQGLLDPEKPAINVYCDDIVKVDILKFVEEHENNNCQITMGLSPTYQNPYGTINIKDGKVISFQEKPIERLSEGRGINTGLAAFSNLKMFVNAPVPSQAEYSIYPGIAEQGQLGVFFVEDWVPVNTKDQLAELKAKLTNKTE
jgi:NDP-sugar pyrophosphorylase family protein